MNTKLYRKCALYRRLFKKELYNKRKDRISNQEYQRLRKQLRIAEEIYDSEIKKGHYKESLSTLAFYLQAYNKVYHV